ncbi:MAG: hypothetical protein HZA78_01615 [Candidatus Schekmanbacteria bacterium]|nr:hypothetical protein [Candidatus Schekmanbacteria bacterium]
MYKRGVHFRYQNIKHLHQIANVLIKHGFGYLVGRLNLLPFFSVHKQLNFFRRYIQKDVPPQSAAVSARLILEELGPTFVKFGQLISSRPDLLPEEFSFEFKKLQDSVPPFTFEEAKQVIEEEFETPLGKLYKSFDETPYAAASIAQVHMAQLHDGQNVVVKVQRPGIKLLIEKDLELLYYFAQLLEERVPDVRLYQPMGVVEELARSIRRELDFIIEANNANRVRENFAGDPTVCVPRIYAEMSSSRVMTMEMLNGISVDEVEQLKAAGLNLKEIAFNGCEAYLKQIFEHGFFHADPHPGNILAGENNRIIFLDFGQVGHLDESHMTHIANVLFAIIDRDYDRLVHEYLMLSYATIDVKVDDFKRDISDFIEPYYGQTLKNIPVGLVFLQGMKLMAKHRVKTPVDLILLAKTFVFVESLGRQLDPDFNLLEIARPYAHTLLKKRLHPKRLVKIVYKNVHEVGEMMKIMPRQLQLMAHKLMQGMVDVSRYQMAMLRLKRRSSQEMTLGIITGALIIGSALILKEQSRFVLIGGVHLGSVGLFIAAFFMALVLYSMTTGNK